MQMGTRVFITCAHLFVFTICNDAQALVAVNKITFFNLDVVQVPVLGGPAVTVINFDETTGCFKNSASRRSSDPEIRCVHSNVYIRIRSKIHRAAHLIIVRTGGKPLGAIIEPIHGNP